MTYMPRRLNSFFCGSTLSGMAAIVADQEELLRQVREALPTGLQGHCLHCLRKNDTLIIQVESAAQATLMRFHSSAILAKLFNTNTLQIRKIQIRSLPASGDITRERSRAQSPSKAAAHQLIASADNFESEEIKSALRRLGRTLAHIETDA